MRRFLNMYYKKMELVISITALFLFLAGNLVEDFDCPLQVIPFITLVVVGVLGNYTYINMRIALWIQTGLIALYVVLGVFDSYSFHHYIFEYVLDWFPVEIIIGIQFFIVFLIPLINKAGFIIYSSVMGALYLIAAVAEGGISITIISFVVCYIALMFFAYELKSTNELGISERVIDYFLEKMSVKEDDDFDIGPDVEIEDELEEDVNDQGMNLLEKLMLRIEVDQVKNDRNKLKERLRKALDSEKEELVLKGKEFLYDDYQESVLTYKMEYDDEQVILSGVYSHRFATGVAGDMLKKKSVLTETFSNIEVPYYANVELNERDFEEGYFGICLPKCSFSKDETDQILETMFDFLRVIILLGNGKSY